MRRIRVPKTEGWYWFEAFEGEKWVIVKIGRCVSGDGSLVFRGLFGESGQVAEYPHSWIGPILNPNGEKEIL